MQPSFKRAAIIATCPVLIATSAMAQDTGGYYAKAFGGISSLQGESFTLGSTTTSLSFDSGTTLGGAIGYDYANSPFRAELEFVYRSGDATDISTGVGTAADFASTSVMLNGYYVFETASDWVPYAGLGLGYLTEIDFDLEGGAGEYSDRGLLGYQAMLGVEYPVSKRLSIYGEARYFSAGSVDLTGTGDATLSANYDTLDFNAGVAYKF